MEKKKTPPNIVWVNVNPGKGDPIWHFDVLWGVDLKNPCKLAARIK